MSHRILSVRKFGSKDQSSSFINLTKILKFRINITTHFCQISGCNEWNLTMVLSTLIESKCTEKGQTEALLKNNRIDLTGGKGKERKEKQYSAYSVFRFVQFFAASGLVFSIIYFRALNPIRSGFPTLGTYSQSKTEVFVWIILDDQKTIVR